jgi:hypothetical protein
MRFLFSFLLLALFAFSGMAENLTTKSGEIYKDYTVRKCKPDGLAIMHATGFTTVPYDELPDAVFKKYAAEIKKIEARAEKIKAQAEKRKRALEKAKQQSEMLKKISLSGVKVEVIQVLNKSAVLGEAGDIIIYVQDIDTKNIVDGQQLNANDFEHDHCWAWRSNYAFCWYCRSHSGYHSKKEIENWIKAQKPCTKPIVTLYLIGTYSYNSVGNVRKKVCRFTYDKNKALKFLKKNDVNKIKFPNTFDHYFREK